MEVFIVFTVLTLGFIHGETCTTPEGSEGTCVVLSKCPMLNKLITPRKKILPKDVVLLKNSGCGFEGGKPKVCCPYMCQTADGVQGKCVDRSACPHLCQNCEVKRCYGTNSICCPFPNEKVEVENCKPKVSAFPPNGETYCCGRESSWVDRFIGAEGEIETGLDKYPWLALIEYVQMGRIGTFCSGVLISGKYVLTAAHCVTNEPVSVRLGEHDTTTMIDCRTVSAGGVDCNDEPLSIAVETTIQYPLYNSSTRRHDIALIRLKEKAPFTDFIRPICLPISDETKLLTNTKLYVAGWGKLNATILQSPFKVHVEVPVVDHETCQKAYSEVTRNVTLWNDQVCAGGEAGKDACKGDSGGPLMFEDAFMRKYVIGVSFGTENCGTQDVPGIYTRVYEYIDWIYSKITP